jgi:hypothetical protein
MNKIVNPLQNRLFDSFDTVLTPKTRQFLENSWQGVFRHAILKLMPVDVLSGAFDPVMGRPTKELYSMCGLMLLMEFQNWTKDQAVNSYCFDMSIHYALNLEPVANELSKRTLERYIVLAQENNLAQITMEKVTDSLIKDLGINIDKQRLDSTHIFSDMASFGRTRMMGVAIKRFLTQVIRYDKSGYEALDKVLQERYTPSTHQLFAKVAKDTQSREVLSLQVAKDMLCLIDFFANKAPHNERDCYKAMVRIFNEQCEVKQNQITIRKHTGGNVMQNSSDPDATFDGHKGPGYQVQISETCNPDNEVQLITCVIPQTACIADSESAREVLDNLQSHDLLPREMVADTAYTNDDNVLYAQQIGVDLVGPTVVNPQDPSDPFEELSIDDFTTDPVSKAVVCCPAGHKPQHSEYDSKTDKTTTIMPESACGNCEFFSNCPAGKVKGQYRLEYTEKQRRLAERRREQVTDVYKERYRIRGGIEATNSGLKRRTGLGKLKVRGKAAVFHAIFMKICGWNILRATACAKMQEKVKELANLAHFLCTFALLMHKTVKQTIRNRLTSLFRHILHQQPTRPTHLQAA